MITNIDIDDAIVAEAMRLSGARTKREVVDRALREMVERRTRPSIRQLFGIGGIEPDYDPKQPWKRGEIAGRFRVEEPRTSLRASAPDRQKRKPSGGRKRR